MGDTSVQTVDLGIDSAGAAQDVVVGMVIQPYGSTDVVDSLLLQTLDGLSGPATFSATWNSAGFAPGYYSVETTLSEPRAAGGSGAKKGACRPHPARSGTTSSTAARARERRGIRSFTEDEDVVGRAMSRSCRTQPYKHREGGGAGSSVEALKPLAKQQLSRSSGGPDPHPYRASAPAAPSNAKPAPLTHSAARRYAGTPASGRQATGAPKPARSWRSAAVKAANQPRAKATSSPL